MREIVKPGDFGISPGYGWPAYMIRLGTFSRYAHAAEVVDVDWNQENFPIQIVEAWQTGVRQRWVALDSFRWSSGGPLDAQLTPEIRANLVRRARSQLHKGYDWPSVFHFIPRFFYAKFQGHAWDRPDEKLFCSELVVWNRREEGIVMFPTTAPGDVSPGMLADFCPMSPGGKP
jgi:hypothetical protein